MTKRYFKIELNGYGGEFTMGKVTADFVNYWKDREEADLIDHLNGAEWDDEDQMDPESPDMTEDGNINVWDCDEYEHMSSVYADNGYWVQEVKLADESNWNEDFQIVDDPHDNEEYVGDAERYDDFEHWIGGRECFTCGEDVEDDIEPVLVYHSSEKGNFGIAYVVTDGADFDPEKVVVSTVETDMGEFIDALYYGKQQLEICYDWADTNGKATYANVGFVNPKWLDEFSEELNQESLDDIFDEEA